MSSNFEGQLTPQENYEREVPLTCPLHGFEVLPAAVCPICGWPEDVYGPGVAMWDELKARGAG